MAKYIVFILTAFTFAVPSFAETLEVIRLDPDKNTTDLNTNQILLSQSQNEIIETKKPKYKQFVRELFFTDVVYPQGKESIKLTLFPIYSDGNKPNLFELPFNTVYGFNDSLQLRLLWSSFVVRDVENRGAVAGLGDLRPGFKYSFMKIRGSNFHAAIAFDVVFPTANVNKGLSNGFINYQPAIILAKDFPKLFNSHIVTRIGPGLVQRIKNPDNNFQKDPKAHQIIWNTGLVIPYKDLSFICEYSWVTNKWNNNGKENQMYIVPGIVWRLPKRWELDLAIPIGLNNTSDNFKIIAKVVHEFDVFKKGD